MGIWVTILWQGRTQTLSTYGVDLVLPSNRLWFLPLWLPNRKVILRRLLRKIIKCFEFRDK